MTMRTDSRRPRQVKTLSAYPPFRALDRALDHLSFVIFGQRAPEHRYVGWIRGNGGYGGGGGQTPPYVPYNPGWDPENRIR